MAPADVGRGFLFFYFCGKLGSMDIYDAIVTDGAYAAYKFTTSTTSYPNIMGPVDPLIASSGARYAVQIVTGPTKPLILGGGVTAKIPCPRFQGDSTGSPFSLECWIDLQTTGVTSILSHTGVTDGIYFDGTKINFTIKYVSGSDDVVSWVVPDLTKAYEIIATYSSSKLNLYVDGLIAASAEVLNTNLIATTADKYLYAGQSAAGQGMLFEAPAMYKFELTADQVARHYAAGRNTIPELTIAGNYNAALFPFTDANRTITSDKTVDWATAGQASNCSNSTVLQPAYDVTDLSLAGTYTFAIPTTDPVAGNPTIYGVKLEWSGTGSYVVEWSMNDGGTWTAMNNGELIPGTYAYNGSSLPLVRITFTAGRASALGDEVAKMQYVIYKTTEATASNNNERTVTVFGNATTSRYWDEPIDTGDYFGMRLDGLASSHARLNTSTDLDVQNIYAIGFWYKVNSTPASKALIDSRTESPSNASYIAMNASAQLTYSGFSAFYVNGLSTASAALTTLAGRWYHVIAVYTAAHNAGINIGQATGFTNFNGTIPSLTVYRGAAPTLAQVGQIYGSYFGVPKLTISDANSIIVTELAGTPNVYSYNWTVSGG